MALMKGHAYCDGACRISNPGLCSCAWVLYTATGAEISDSTYLGPEFHTNNYAEYQGLLRLLRWLYKANVRNVIIYCDSELVINQSLHNWNIENAELKKFADEAYGLLMQGCHVLKHCKGHDGNKGNERADELCNVILDAHMEEYYANKTENL